MNVTTGNLLLLTVFAEVDHGVVGSQSSTSSSPLLRQGLSLASAAVLHTLGWVTLEFSAHFPVSVFSNKCRCVGLTDVGATPGWLHHFRTWNPGHQACAKSSFTYRVITLVSYLDS